MGSQARLGPLSQGKGREEMDGGGAEFQSSRNLVPGNLESEQEIHLCRHKEGKEGVNHPARTYTPALCHSQLLQRRLQGGGGKYTHASFYMKLRIFVMDS